VVEVQKGRNRRNFHGGIAPALLELVQAGIVRLLDGVFGADVPRRESRTENYSFRAPEQ
jgi:hypothetical protein